MTSRLGRAPGRCHLSATLAPRQRPANATLLPRLAVTMTTEAPISEALQPCSSAT
jgi:hypothetical protein